MFIKIFREFQSNVCTKKWILTRNLIPDLELTFLFKKEFLEAAMLLEFRSLIYVNTVYHLTRQAFKSYLIIFFVTYI